jgi:hypothetical protein
VLHTDRWLNVRPRALPHHPPEPPFGRCDATGSAVSSTSTCRSRDVTEFSAPTGLRPLRPRRLRRSPLADPLRQQAQPGQDHLHATMRPRPQSSPT